MCFPITLRFLEMADSRTTKINFYFIDIHSTLTHRTLLKRFIHGIFKSEKKLLEELKVIFCKDSYLLNINQEYLSHDDYTDIITFDLSENASPTIGEIYISLDRVKENAKIYRESWTRELHRVIFHGVLHLCGYKDKSPKNAREMKAKEEEYLQKYSQFVSRETRST